MRVLTTTLLLLGLAWSGAMPLGAVTDAPVVVSFVFPGGVTKSTELTDNEVRSLLHANIGYMVEWWVRGALAKLQLPHTISVVDATSKAVAVTLVDGVANGPTGRWVLYVDGIRSRYHINTQVRQHERQVKLVYEQVGSSSG